jgi:subtilisin family serine protease
VGIAIIDTGIDLTHPDLNVQGNVTCVPGTPSGNDDHGHGTHCAGIAAAINNAIGVRGVAPNAKLYAVKVLASNGSGDMSWVIAGVDWVTANAGNIRVANMSLGGPDSLALKNAIHNSVAAGVAYCVAAGNSARDASSTSPANCPDALTVSAIVDTDGQCGHHGRRSTYGKDDTFASFSNWGPFVHIAAPGVNIYSTYKGGSYATMSGTSMAAPHVTGAAAQYIASQLALGFSPSPTVVYDALIDNGTLQIDPCGFTGDSDGIPEPLVSAAGL